MRSSLLPAPPPAARAAAIGAMRRSPRRPSAMASPRALCGDAALAAQADGIGDRGQNPQDGGRVRGGAIASEEEKGGCGEQQKTFCGHLGGGCLTGAGSVLEGRQRCSCA